MKWVIRKFGLLISLIMALLGAIYLPADFLNRESAIQIAKQSFTAGNREIILFAFCFLALARLAYYDFRRAINDAHWPPIRHKLRYGLGVVFKRDQRIAELRNVAADPLMTQILEAAIAREILEKLDWESIPHPPALPIQDDDAPLRDDYHMYKQRSGPTKASLAEIAYQVGIIEHRLSDLGLLERVNRVSEIDVSALKYGRRAEAEREAACQKIDKFNAMKRELRETLKCFEGSWSTQKLSVGEGRLRQLLQGIGSRTPL